MDGPGDYHTERSQSERERRILYDITYTWNLKYGTTELAFKTETDSQRADWFLRGRVGGRDELGVWEY